MGAIGYSIGAMLKRPFIIVFFSIFVLTYAIIDYCIPVLNLIVLMNTFISGDIFQSLVSLIQWVLKLLITPNGIIFGMISVVVAAFLIAATLSGYFGIINNTLDKKAKYKGEFGELFKKYFIRILFTSIIFLTIGIIFVVVLMVACIPALIVTKAAIVGKSGFFITAVFVDFITIAVVFFGIMFLRIYLVFWFPSIFINGKKAFLKGKRLVDSNFWSIVVRFMILDVLFILFQIFIIKMGTSFVFLPVKWLFYTVFFGFYITYIFALFKTFIIKNERRIRRQNEENQ
jgi:hypothetical protein